MIRLATPSDAAPIAAIYAPAVTDLPTSFELAPPDADEMARRVATTLARTPWLVCERDGAVLGYAYASAHRERAAYRWSVDVSAYVRADARRLGVARALYASLLALLARQGFRNAYAGVTLPNDASVGLHQAVGFTPVGAYRGVGYKLGAWHDVAWFERPLLPRVPEPPEPVPLPAISPDVVRDALAEGVPLLRLGRGRGSG
jgi:L-amino acid N-acyltransferase YncA